MRRNKAYFYTQDGAGRQLRTLNHKAGKAVAPQRAGNFRDFAGQHMAFFVIFAQKPNKSGQSPEYGFFCGLFYGRINEQSKSKEAGL